MKILVEDKNTDMGGIYFTDLNDSKVFVSDFAGKAIIISGGTQKASKESERWGKALKSAYNDSVVFLNIAFVPKQPPASIMSSVKNQLKRGFGKVPFLISWGDPSDIIHITNENLTHIFFIDRQGYLRIQFAEKYSDNCLSELVEMINRYV